MNIRLLNEAEIDVLNPELSMMKPSLLSILTLVVFVLGSHVSTTAQDVKSIAAIRAVLDAQVAAWNRSNVEGYMNGYERSPHIVFISGDRVTRGWQTVLERYKRTYATREKMGLLTFSDVEVTILSKDVAIVLGRWHLRRSKDEPHGRFTLLFRKTKAGWKIVHDHTSSG